MKVVKKIIKWFGISLSVLLLLLMLFVLFLQTDYGQNLLRKEAVKYLSDKLGTKVSVESISTDFFSHLVIKQITLDDKTGNVLLHIGKIETRHKLSDLFKNKLSISAVTIDTIYFRMARNEKDSAFNFDFIIRAFSDTSTQAQAIDTTASNLKLNFGALSVSQLHFIMLDERSKQFYDVSNSKLNIAINTLDPSKQFYDINYLKSDGLIAKINQGISNYKDTVEEKGESVLPVIKIHKVSLLNTEVATDIKGNGLNTNSRIENFNADDVVLNLNENRLDVKQLLVDNHQSKVLIKSITEQLNERATPEIDTIQKPFVFAFERIQLIGNDLQYDKDFVVSKSTSDFNADHIHLKPVQLELSNLYYDGFQLSGQLKKLTAFEQCGLDLNQLSTDFSYAANGINLVQLKLKTPYSTINGDIIASYESIAAVIENAQNLKLDVKLNPLLIGKNDLKHFIAYADTNAQLKSILSEDIFIEGALKGRVDDLKIAKLKVKNGDMTISVSGSLSGLPEINKLKGSLKIEEISGTAENVLKLLPPGVLPDNIAIPEKFTVSGTIDGQNGNYVLNLLLNSTDGNLSINGNVNQPDNLENIAYDVYIQSDGIQLDRILKDTIYGNSVFDIQAMGQGVKPKTASLHCIATIPFVHYYGHDYKNIMLNGQLSKALLDATFNIDDSACKINATANYSFDSLNAFISTNAHIAIIDFNELGFTTDSIKLKADIKTERLHVTAEHINGTADFCNIVITKGLNKYLIDTVALQAIHVDSSQSLGIHAPFLNFKLAGVYEINALQGVVQNLLLNYLVRSDIKVDSVPDALATIDGDLMYHPLIEAFVPGLTSLSNVKFSGTIDTKANDLMISVQMPQAVYNSVVIDSTILRINTISDSLKISLQTLGIEKDPVKLYKTHLSGRARDGVVAWNFDSENNHDTVTYNLNGIFINDTASLNLSFGESQLFNKEVWSINENNKIDYYFDKNILADFQLSSGNKKLSITSAVSNNGLPVVLQLNNFPISTISKIINQDSTFAEGLINGEAGLSALNPMRFYATLSIDSLNVFGSSLGQLNLKANNDNGYAVDMNLKGAETDFKLTAALSEQDLLSGDLTIKQVNLKTIQPFIKNYFSKTEGILQGSFSLSGSTAKPLMNGALTVKDLSGIYNDYGTFFRVPEAGIYFKDNGIALDKFMVYDSLNNTANISGVINLTSINEFTYDFNVKTNHFLALNKKINAEQTIYGPAFVTADLNLKSKSGLISVDGKVKIDEKSIINIELSKSDTIVEASNGVVLYYDQSQSADTVLVSKIVADSLQHVDDLKISLQLDFEITKTSKLNIMLDKVTGDYLNVYGDASISIDQLPGRALTLNGKFTIDRGEYLLSISQFVRRKFEVLKGSSLKWSGLPTEAEIDLEALYNIEASVAPLLSGSQSSSNESYQQRLPFEVYLKLKDKLLKPRLSFRLDMPVKDQNAFSGAVYGRIKQINLQESELNKQAMGLLIFKQFIPQDPMASSNSSYSLIDVESAARNTAGEILSGQLNSIMASHVKAVDVSFDFESRSDYSTGSKVDETDLTINLSKSLFNDRATVKVGSTFALSGSETHKQNTSGLAGDVAVEYKLTKNGRYRVKVYSLNQYDSTIEGQVVQTGVSFVIILDFNTFRKMFHSDKSSNE